MQWRRSTPSPCLSVFERVFNELDAVGRAVGRIYSFRVLDGQLLIALEGTQYHHSESIHCKQCRSVCDTPPCHGISMRLPVSAKHGQRRNAVSLCYYDALMS